MIIDAHVHLPAGEAFRDLNAKKERLLREMDRNGVDRCVVIADSWPESDIGATDEVAGLFPGRADSRVSVVGGISPLVAYEDGLAKLRRHLDRGQLVGIKLYTGHEAFYLTDERLTEVYEMAMACDVPVLFHSGWDDPQYGDADVALKVAERYPGLRLVCCHCWYPDIERCMRVIDCPNVCFDLSSVADNEGILDAIAGHVKGLITHAPDRVMFGSDSFGCDMAAHIRFVRGLNLSPEIERKVFADNARTIYRL